MGTAFSAKSVLRLLARRPSGPELIMAVAWLAAVWAYVSGHFFGREGLVPLSAVGSALAAAWCLHLLAVVLARLLPACQVQHSRWDGLRWALVPAAGFAAIAAILWSDCDLIKKVPLVGGFDWPKVIGNTAIKPTPGRVEQHERNKVVVAGKRDAEVVFLGDSITNSWRTEGRKAWQTFEPLKAVNLGVGEDRTQNVLWRLQHGALDGCNPKVLVLLIGGNNLGSNTTAEIAEAIKAIIDLVCHERPQMRVLLLGIFPRGADPADPAREKIRDVNARIARLDDGKYIRFLDIGGRFLDPEGNLKGMLSDHFHPSPEGYCSWADAIGPHMQAMLLESRPGQVAASQ